MHKVALPSSKIFSTQDILLPVVEKGDEKLASLEQNEIPMFPYLMAAQSLAPSPIILDRIKVRIIMKKSK